MLFHRYFSERGSTPVKFIAIFSIIIIVIFAVFQVLVFAGMRQEHKAFMNAVELRIQALSTNSLPETQQTLSRDIYAMLNRMEARYEPHHVQIQPGSSGGSLDVQVWYSRPHKGLLLPGAKQFYGHIQQDQVPPQLVQAPLPTPTPTPTPEPVEESKPEEIERVSTPIPTPTVTVIRSRPAGHLTDENFVQEVSNSPLPVMVFFWAPWCGYCKKAMPAVDQASSIFFGEMRVYKLNIDRNKTTASQFSVRGIPDFIFFNKGKTIARKSGFRGKQWLFTYIRENLEKANN